MLLNHHLWAHMCGGDCVWRPTAALCLYFDVFVSSGHFQVWRVFPPANDCMQVSLRTLQSTATGCHPDQRKLRIWT